MITLITDFGERGGYAGIMKGVILTINPRCPIVDITHHIAPYNIKEAAFVLGSAYPFFPEHEIHLVVVDPAVGGPRRPIIVEPETHRFVGPDNGVFSLVFARERVTGVWEIDAGQFDALPGERHLSWQGYLCPGCGAAQSGYACRCAGEGSAFLRAAGRD